MRIFPKNTLLISLLLLGIFMACFGLCSSSFSLTSNRALENEEKTKDSCKDVEKFVRNSYEENSILSSIFSLQVFCLLSLASCYILLYYWVMGAVQLSSVFSFFTSSQN